MPEVVKIYRNDGSSAEMVAIDARAAVKRHPKEWSNEPFSDDSIKAAQKKADDEAAAKAKADADVFAKEKADAEANAKAAQNKS